MVSASIFKGTSVRNGIVVAVLGIGVFLFYRATALHFLATSLNTNDAFFGADTAENADVIRGLDLDETSAAKHPLFSPVAFSVFRFLEYVTQEDRDRAVATTLAVLAALNTLGAYLVLRRHAGSEARAGLFAAYYAFTFAHLVFWSVPETYVVTTATVIIYAAWLSRALNTGLTQRSLAIAAGIAGLGGLFNPPILLLGTPTAFLAVRRYGWPRGALVAFALAVLSCVVFLAGHVVLFGATQIELFVRYAHDWVSLEHLISPADILLVILSFGTFSIVGPVGPRAAIHLSDVAGYIEPLRIVALAAHLAAVVIVIRHVVRNHDDVAMAMIVFAATLGVFYICFNPDEALLYSTQVLFPWAITLVRALGFQSSPKQWRFSLLMAAVVAVSNIVSLFS